MKKVILLVSIVFVTLMVQRSSAQFSIGPQIGFNWATLTGTNLTIDPKPEWHAGLMFDVGFGKHFSLMPSILYSKRGYKYEQSTSITTIVSNDTTIVTYATASVDAVLGYLDIPVLLNIYFGERKGFMFNAGPQLSLLLTDQSVITTTATASINGGNPTVADPVSENEFKFNKSDIALMAGIGYKLPKLLMVYARVSTGFGKVQEDNSIIKDENAGKNFTIEVGAALTFGGN